MRSNSLFTCGRDHRPLSPLHHPLSPGWFVPTQCRFCGRGPFTYSTTTTHTMAGASRSSVQYSIKQCLFSYSSPSSRPPRPAPAAQPGSTMLNVALVSVRVCVRVVRVRAILSHFLTCTHNTNTRTHKYPHTHTDVKSSCADVEAEIRARISVRSQPLVPARACMQHTSPCTLVMNTHARPPVGRERKDRHARSP